jgi:hypothetical protein
VVEFMMLKDPNQRYRNPDDLIGDLECLLRGEPPKLARQRIEEATLRQLGEGEEEEEYPNKPGGLPWLWAGILGALLALSLVGNLLLMLFR